MANESITEIVPKRLGQHLLATVSELKEFYPEFPSANEIVKHPSVSIFAGTTDFRALAPYKKSTGAIVSSQADVEWVVGIYDFSLQIDLWCRNKEERDDIYNKLFDALNPDILPMGLVLNMAEYFGQLCDYQYSGHTANDSEERSQRDEWRLTLNVLATCKGIRLRKEFIMETPATPAEIEQAGEIATGADGF